MQTLLKMASLLLPNSGRISMLYSQDGTSLVKMFEMAASHPQDEVVGGHFFLCLFQSASCFFVLFSLVFIFKMCNAETKKE